MKILVTSFLVNRILFTTFLANENLVYTILGYNHSKPMKILITINSGQFKYYLHHYYSMMLFL